MGALVGGAAWWGGRGAGWARVGGTRFGKV